MKLLKFAVFNDVKYSIYEMRLRDQLGFMLIISQEKTGLYLQKYCDNYLDCVSYIQEEFDLYFKNSIK